MLLCRSRRCSTTLLSHNYVGEGHVYPTISFTLRGKAFEKSGEDFLNATRGLEPGRVQKYSTLIHGKRYPIRQVLAAVTKLPAIAITSQDAYRVLEKFGFTVDTEE
jgi:hypothetical protein